MRFTVILFVLTRSSRLFCDVVTPAATSTDFVDILRRNLRRNNDDYIESTTIYVKIPNPYLLDDNTRQTQNTSTKETTLAKNKIFSYQRLPPQNNLNVDTKNNSARQRRVFYDSEGKSAEVKSPTPNITKNNHQHLTPMMPQLFFFSSSPTARTTTTKTLEIIVNRSSTTPLTKNKINMFRSMTTKKTKTVTKTTSQRTIPTVSVTKEKVSTSVERATFRSFHNNGKIGRLGNEVQIGRLEGDGKNGRLEKMKTFINRNKQLFEEFVDMKRKESAKPLYDDTPDITMYANLRGQSSDDEMQNGNLQSMLRQRAASVEVTSLSPDLLDMAPARGGRIHALRVKGRLCQRHILIPEGPKYDSKGVAYVGAYGHKRGRDFGSSKRPQFLLPRCCNCCKKSVLGCE